MSFWKAFTSPITLCGRLVLETSSDAHISQIPRDVPKDYRRTRRPTPKADRSEEHTSELQSQSNLVCRLLLAKKKSCDEAHFRLADFARGEPIFERGKCGIAAALEGDEASAAGCSNAERVSASAH